MEFALIKNPNAAIFGEPNAAKETDGRLLSTIVDEGLYGMGVRLTGSEVNGYVPVQSHYHYAGYVKTSALFELSLEQLQSWERSPLYCVDALLADVTTEPGVKGYVLASLPKGALIEVIKLETEHAWSEVRLVTGETGYIRRQFLEEKRFSQAGLWEEELPAVQIVDDRSFRQELIREAKKYLGAQYRWGGKTTLGLDCSGLTSMVYMLQGVLIYRDAKIVEGFPIQEIPIDKKQPGDLLYFPGHIALYMGNDQYIHSTGLAGSGGVVTNSFDPKSADYRADLAQNMYAAGSLFV